MGLSGKDGMRGDEVEKYYRDGHIREIAECCEGDVVNTYRVWLRYELFRGRLSDADFHASELSLVDFIKARANTKPHRTDSEWPCASVAAGHNPHIDAERQNEPRSRLWGKTALHARPAGGYA
jgi:hypothetical protein